MIGARPRRSRGGPERRRPRARNGSTGAAIQVAGRARGLLLPGVLLAGLLLGGCVTPEPDLTGGISLRYERRQEPMGIAVWTIATDATISYAGGRDALRGRESWTGRLDAAAIDRLAEAVSILRRKPSKAGADVAPEPAVAAVDPRVRTSLALRTAEGRLRVEEAGDPPRLAALLDLLREVSRPRLDRVLQRLPRATDAPAMESGAAPESEPGAGAGARPGTADAPSSPLDPAAARPDEGSRP